MADRQPKRKILRRATRKIGVAREPNRTGVYPGQKGKGCPLTTLLLAGGLFAALLVGWAIGGIIALIWSPE